MKFLKKNIFLGHTRVFNVGGGGGPEDMGGFTFGPGMHAFGGGHGHGMPKRQDPPVVHDLSVSLEDIYKGKIFINFYNGKIYL